MQGVWEKDEIRKDDSFTTFEEIFELAIHQKVHSLHMCTGAASGGACIACGGMHAVLTRGKLLALHFAADSCDLLCTESSP